MGHWPYEYFIANDPLSTVPAIPVRLVTSVRAHNCRDNRKVAVPTTQTNIISLRNKTTVLGQPNDKRVHVDVLSVNVTSGDCAFRIILNPTLGGTPVFTSVSPSGSFAEFDIAGTTVSSGTQSMTFYAESNSSQFIDLSHLGVYLDPGDVLTISAAALIKIVNAAVGITWHEES